MGKLSVKQEKKLLVYGIIVAILFCTGITDLVVDVTEELEKDETIWDCLGQGKAYCKDWEDKHEVDDEMIADAIDWLAPGHEVETVKQGEPT
jgi:hypothetical protein